SGLRREEVSFTRLEYGGGIGARKFFRRSATDVSIRYNYQVLEAVDADPDVEVDGVRRPAVGAFIGDIRHDRRDNPLYPRRGYKVFANIELASEYVGGDVDYQRLDMITSYHRIITRSHAIHLGLSHGFIAAAGDSHENIPFNRRFFPGGENSIRGYPEGEASPRNAEGDFVGAEAYVLGNVEFEQAITPNWSLVLFGDGLGYARDLERYPAEKVLFSVGAGIRWKTFIGPVRLEYGHNVNPRPGDPSGTVHFSLGFPF
ncbi:MAG TPA: BamA/TamA family outer membrane protein, partial [Verrucomicrobiota bacterium]|nr:BamA/TamA family outer membrane protein [Verrucomicrobiota bacterium]